MKLLKAEKINYFCRLDTQAIEFWQLFRNVHVQKLNANGSKIRVFSVFLTSYNGQPGINQSSLTEPSLCEFYYEMFLRKISTLLKKDLLYIFFDTHDTYL